MTTNQHTYQLTIQWTGNTGSGTATYRSYERSHDIIVNGKPTILGSSDPAFRGDPTRYNPEELLVASLSSCHMLWYLHLCAVAKIRVVDYVDQAIGTMSETSDGGGRFTEVLLQPVVTLHCGILSSDQKNDLQHRAMALHEQAHHLCFIANSVNFPVHCRSHIHLQAIEDSP